jgi:hypothetical protein
MRSASAAPPRTGRTPAFGDLPSVGIAARAASAGAPPAFPPLLDAAASAGSSGPRSGTRPAMSGTTAAASAPPATISNSTLGSMFAVA